MRTRCCSLFALLLLSGAPAFAQHNSHDPDGSILSGATSLIHSHFGPDYSVYGYEVLDSLLSTAIGKDYSYDCKTDPYGTLAHCIIFWTCRNRGSDYFAKDIDAQLDTSIICISKNGVLLWNSGNQIKGDVRKLLFSYDLNKDKKVELGFVTGQLQKDNCARLYVIGWEGSQGAMLNDIDGNGQSTLLSSEAGLFSVFDLDGDGIYEIRGCYPESGESGSGWFPDNPSSTAPYITYGWDGMKYGYSPSVRQVAGYEFLPRNRIKLLVRANVLPQGDNYKYAYVFKSDSTSKQLIDYIYVASISDSIGTTAFYPWGGGFTWVLGGFYWGAASDNKLLQRAGEERTGAGFLSRGLPTIKNIYAQGYTSALCDVRNDYRTDERIVADVVTNSYATATVGPCDSRVPFMGADGLDSLSNYVTEARSLGWIKEQSTANKYLGYFASGKSQLQANNTADARTTLQTVLQDVNVDSASNLTSEAYALIRFNTEYLLAQLPRR